MMECAMKLAASPNEMLPIIVGALVAAVVFLGWLAFRRRQKAGTGNGRINQ